MSLDRVASFLLSNTVPFFPPKPKVEKRCTRCAEIKPLSSFYRITDRRYSSGDGGGIYYTARCKDCMRTVTRLAMRKYRRVNGVWQRKQPKG